MIKQAVDLKYSVFTDVAKSTQTKGIKMQLACCIQRWIIYTAAGRWISMPLWTEVEMGGAEFSTNERI